jgi:histidine triad (HIT) family protein
MALPEDQIPQIKKQLLEQIETTFPEEKKESAIKQVEEMNGEQLEQFLIQNNLIKGEGQAPAPAGNQKCIFCSIVFGETPSHKIEENKSSIAILELNPISKGHVLVVPKSHIETGDKLPSQAFTLAKKIAKKIKPKLKPKDVQITSSNIMGHEIVNVLPIYENENLGSERKKAEESELQELQKLLQSKPRKPRTKSLTPKAKSKKQNTKSDSKKLWLPVRIP